jgi:hypothetical protein
MDQGRNRDTSTFEAKLDPGEDGIVSSGVRSEGFFFQSPEK